MISHRQLVITADDFGYSVERDQGILECHRFGAITRASLMVNAVNAKRAASRANNSGLTLGETNQKQVLVTAVMVPPDYLHILPKRLSNTY